jgi:hypothetical protein
MLDILMQFLQNSTSLVFLAIQFLLGLMLGYVTMKAIKYILALIAILILGVALNIWALGISLEGMASKFGEYSAQVKNLILGLAETLGLLTIGPVLVGFIIGALISLRIRK